MPLELEYKDFPDVRFVIVENSQTNPTRMLMEYSSNPPRLKSVGRINSLYQMHDLMSESFEMLYPYREDSTVDTTTYQESESTEQRLLKNGLFFAPDFPEFLRPNVKPLAYQAAPQFPQNVITWGVVRSEPGSVSGTPFRGTQEIRPRTREFLAFFGNSDSKYLVGEDSTSIRSSTNRMAYIRMKAQVFDNLVQYNIWSKSNYEVERLTEWFEEEYMDNYIGMFREAGIVNMYFDRRVRDDTMLQMNNDYHVRSVLYYIRTERVKPEYVGPINQINVNITIRDLQQMLVSEDHNTAFAHDKLISKWIQKNQFGG